MSILVVGPGHLGFVPMEIGAVAGWASSEMDCAL